MNRRDTQTNNMTYDSSDDDFLSSDDDEVEVLRTSERITSDMKNDLAVGAQRKLGGLDSTIRADHEDYMTERVRRERAYQWHSRWALPTYKEMKAQVRRQKGKLDITEDDVDLLPWGPGGMLNRREYERLQKGESVMTKPRKPKKPQTISLNVQLPNGNTIKLEGVRPKHDTAADLKARIQKKDPSLDTKRQILSYANGEKLPVGETCKDMKLSDGDTLQLAMKKVPITVTHKGTGRSYTVMVDPMQPVQAIKQDLEGKTKMPVDNQNLYKDGQILDNDTPAADYGITGGSELELEPNGFPVKIKMPDGTKHTIDIKGSDTADDIKQKIQQKTGMEVERQAVSKKGDKKKELPEDKTAVQMGLQENDTLLVDIKKVPIKVRTMDGDEITVKVDPIGETVGDLKERLQKETQMPAEEQNLFKNGNLLDDDDKALADYGVKKNSELDLEPKHMTVMVDMPNGDKVPVTIKPSDTSDDVKNKIETETGMPADEQLLQKNGQELPDGKSARDMGLREGDNLQVEPKSISVNVEMPDGSKVPIDVKLSDSADDIKQKVEAKTGMPTKKQILKKGGKELPSGRAAKDMGLKNGDDLKVEPKTIDLNVTMPDGSKVPIQIKPKDTTDDIKRKIEKKTGMPVSKQALKQDGSELPDGRTAKDLGLQDGDDLDVEPKVMEVKVAMPDGSKVPISIKPSDTADDIKRAIEAKTGLQVPRQVLKKDGDELPNGETAQDMGIKDGDDDLAVEILKVPVTVRTMDGDEIEMMVDPLGDTIGDMKKQLAAESGIPANNQALFKNGKELDKDGKTVDDYGIGAGTVLDLEPKTMTCMVTMPDERRVPVQIKPSDTSSDIKRKIEEKTGMEPKKQILKKDGDELPERQSARDMGLRDNDELKVEPRNITVDVAMPDGSRVPVEIKPSDTANDIKRKIEDKTGMEAPRQVLKDSNGRELPNGQTAQDLGLEDGDGLQVEVKKVPVNVRTMDGDTIQVMVDPVKDTIGDLKDQLAGESGIPANNQALFKDGRELDRDYETAGDCGIKAGTTLDREPKRMNVSVLMPDGKKVPVEISPRDTGNDIKEQLEEKTGMPVDTQQLMMYNDEVGDNQTARDLGLRDGDDCLEVQVKKVPITVNCPNGKSVQIMVDPNDRLEQIKKDLEPESGIPVRNQNLYKNGELLNNNYKKAGDYGIKKGTVLDLEDEEERRRREDEERRRREREEEERRKAAEEEARRAEAEAIASRTRRKPNRPPPITHGDDPLERAYRWYTRIMQPHREGMIKMVKKNPSGYDITPEHVDLLPWIKRGKILDFPLLAEMLEEIVAKRKAQGLPF